MKQPAGPAGGGGPSIKLLDLTCAQPPLRQYSFHDKEFLQITLIPSLLTPSFPLLTANNFGKSLTRFRHEGGERHRSYDSALRLRQADHQPYQMAACHMKKRSRRTLYYASDSMPLRLLSKDAIRKSYGLSARTVPFL